MLPVAVLHHLERPFLGNVGSPLRAAGLELDQRLLRRGDALPDLDEVSAIVTLGGEQSILELDRYPYLQAEEDLLGEAVERRMPVLGICLGGQLLSHALGGTVRHAGRSIAWLELEPRPEAAGDPLVDALPRPVVALHWNEDVFDLPPGGVELLDRPGPGVEMFRAGACAWGMQFHPDADAAALDGWYSDHGSSLAAAGLTEAAARAADERHASAQSAGASALFEAFAGVVTGRVETPA